MSKNNFQERLRKMEDTKQRFSIRKFSIGAASVLIGLTIFGMGNETVHAAEQPAQNQNGEVQTSAVNKESDASEAKQESVTSEATEKKREVSVDQKASTAQLENKAPVSAVKEEQPADPTPAAGNDKAALATTTTLNVDESSVVGVTESKAKAAVQDENSITVTDANGLIDAIQNGTATTINIDKNIDLGEKTSSNYTNTNISNKRNIIIQSADGKHYTVDFNGYGFNMYSNDYGVTFKDLDLYGRSYFGIVRSAGSYTFDNVNYTGSQLIYTDSGYNTTVNFDGNVTAHSVGSYTSPLNNKSQSSQGGNNQQVIQFAAGTNTINFNSGSTVTLTTTNSNVLEVDGGKTTINVKNGAQVSLNPHTQNGPEQINGMNMDGIARGIASKGDTTLNIDQGGNLDINLTKNTEDKYLSSALYLNSGATINVNGNLNINSDGTPYYRYQGWNDPVYINGNAAINVNGGSFKVNATNMGDYKGSVVTSNGNSTIAISHHGTFDVTGDGTQATGVSLGNGSTFTSTQPKLFNISMPNGATAIKNGKVQFKGVKTSADGQPVGEIDITYASDGTPTVTKVTSYDEATTTATRTAVNNAKNKINLVAAGEEVNLSNVSFVKNADGTYTMSGNANTADNKGAYVYISVNGQVHQVAPTDSQTLWTAEATGDPTSFQVPYTAETGADGKFSVNLGKLNDSDQVSVYGAKDFVQSDTDKKTVSEWMAAYNEALQKAQSDANAAIEEAATKKKQEITDAL
ncbi:YSIRK-type signal peptide-containing protein, partial [uncultured Lactobacillus sp.]|uniref:YSIRK-type signal peptide-containing protein n=1 Tax=uncultured Lactobacillus sp. TaxID=153152 RepID=UPI002610B79C